MAKPLPDRRPHERQRAYDAYCAWLALPHPRSVRALTEASGIPAASIRRWRTIHRWDRRAAEYDGRYGDPAPPPPSMPVPGTYDADDPLGAARAQAQAHLTEYIGALHSIAMHEDAKPHLRVSALSQLIEVAGLVKPSRPKETKRDPMEKARRVADTIAAGLAPDRALDLLEALEAQHGDAESATT